MTKFLVRNKSNKQNSFTNVNLYWWICGAILCNYKRVILWLDLLERLVYWNCGNVILTQTPKMLQFGRRMDRRPLKQNYNKSLAMSLLEFLCFSCVLRMFFFFEGLWWKFFGVLEAWIHRASLIYGFLKFLEAFELYSSELWDLGRWFEWFCFECSSYSCRASMLLNPLWCCLKCGCLGVC